MYGNLVLGQNLNAGQLCGQTNLPMPRQAISLRKS